ncbi:polysaccharide deacetylase family protein [Pectinatus sottacetonis]|uniref:polysaccharide deacetylase family protein n=1 Tax=Pectinatus sottacetonis TaxID=1002795 RepID=UPI002EDB9B0A
MPILMYHRIAEVTGDRNSLPENKFIWQLEYLHANGFHTITPEMLYDFYTTGIKLPRKPILLTFDDGYKDTFTVALPLLKKYNMTAVVFPIGNWVGKKNKWENFGKQETTTMTWNELILWQKNGQSSASHTMEHPFLTNCSEPQLLAELVNSKKILEDKLNSHMDFLCYPYGNFNSAVISMAKQAGYKAAFAIFEGVNLSRPDLFALPRIPIPAHQSKWEFKLKVSCLFLLFVAMRKWERKIKQWR